jgi:hypothetical protein
MNPSLNWLLFDDDREIGRKVWLGYDATGKFRAAHVEQEVDAVLEANAALEKETHGKRFGDYNLVASVPLTAFEKAGLGDAIDGQDRRYLSKYLNDSDHSKFRTSRGRV